MANYARVVEASSKPAVNFESECFYTPPFESRFVNVSLDDFNVHILVTPNRHFVIDPLFHVFAPEYT